MPPQFIELRFRGAERADVPDPSAGRSGIARVIGKTFDAASDRYVCSEEPGLLRITKSELESDKVFLRKAVAQGSLHCADKATADALGLPFADKETV